jgi:hypothetical protein
MQKWIAIKDKRPTDRTICWIYQHNKRQMSIAFYREDLEGWFDVIDSYNFIQDNVRSSVTHYIPFNFPPAPKIFKKDV